MAPVQAVIVDLDGTLLDTGRLGTGPSELSSNCLYPTGTVKLTRD